MNPETPIMKRIMLECGTGPTRLFRQNAGMGWIGRATKIEQRRSITVHPGDVVIHEARPFHAGIEGMSDLGGWHTVEITPEMVGQRVAVYVAVEVKTDTGRARPEQLRFLAAVSAAGGRAGIARSVPDAAAILAGDQSDQRQGKLRQR